MIVIKLLVCKYRNIFNSYFCFLLNVFFFVQQFQDLVIIFIEN